MPFFDTLTVLDKNYEDGAVIMVPRHLLEVRHLRLTAAKLQYLYFLTRLDPIHRSSTKNYEDGAVLMVPRHLTC